MPAWPGWDGLHPLVIHFPIALLMVAPLFVALAVISRRRSIEFSLAALVLLVLGTAAVFVAVSTGTSAAELADHSPAIDRVLLTHEELAETTRNTFALLTALYAAFVLLRGRVRLLARPAVARAANGVFLVALLAAALLVVNTAHQGGRLVHQFGIHAIIPAAVDAPPAAAN